MQQDEHATAPKHDNKIHGRDALQNMNTELSPEITRTSSNTHGKIASNNSFKLCRK